jgi:threonine dehydrogenase-like Zn-dependent dehydrogenase
MNDQTLLTQTPVPARHYPPSEFRTAMMRANVFRGPKRIGVEELPRPRAGAGEAVIRTTRTTICGTDLHILRGEYPVKAGLVIGHEPVGVIAELGEGVTGYEIGDGVMTGAITPCGQWAQRSSSVSKAIRVRMKMSRQMGADRVLDPKQCDVVAEVKKLTGGGADVAIEALGLQKTFENGLRGLRLGGTLSSLCVYSGKLQVPYDAFAAGLGDYKS